MTCRAKSDSSITDSVAKGPNTMVTNNFFNEQPLPNPSYSQYEPYTSNSSTMQNTNLHQIYQQQEHQQQFMSQQGYCQQRVQSGYTSNEINRNFSLPIALKNNGTQPANGNGSLNNGPNNMYINVGYNCLSGSSPTTPSSTSSPTSVNNSYFNSTSQVQGSNMNAVGNTQVSYNPQQQQQQQSMTNTQITKQQSPQQLTNYLQYTSNVIFIDFNFIFCCCSSQLLFIDLSYFVVYKLETHNS
jgi:hypothetical protein